MLCAERGQPITALLIGYGSVGQRFAQALSERAIPCTIIDPGESARDRFEAASLAHARFMGATWPDLSTPPDLGIIASWGPDHFEPAMRLLRADTRRLILEKPVVTRLSDYDRLLETASARGTRVVVHHRWRYVPLLKAIKTLAVKHDLGPPRRLTVEGGALCLATGGTHWMDFATLLFDGAPASCTADLSTAAINPRSAGLMFVDGIASWRWPGGQQLVICLDNKASIAPLLKVTFPHAVLSFDFTLQARLERRPPDTVDLSRMTRYGLPSETLFAGRLTDNDRNTVEDVLEDALADAAPLSPLASAKTSIEMLIGALTASEVGRTLPLLLQEPEFRDRSWKVT